MEVLSLEDGRMVGSGIIRHFQVQVVVDYGSASPDLEIQEKEELTVDEKVVEFVILG